MRAAQSTGTTRTKTIEDLPMRSLKTDATDAWLTKIAVTWSATAEPASGAPQIAVATEDGACISMWRPNRRERLRLALGAPVRVLMNFSLHGPLHLDTEAGFGASARD